MSNVSADIIAAIDESRRVISLLKDDDDGDPLVCSAAQPSPPLVSVEVLAYNHAWCLRRCVESIVGQKTNFQFEIIIGNDCSTDDTQLIAEQLQSEHPDLITIVTTKRNVGLNRNARNVRRLMRGKYAAFCEADDWWLVDDKLQRQVDRMERNPKLSLLHGLARFYDEVTKSSRDSVYRFPRRKPTFDWILDETYRIQTAGVMCRVADLMRLYRESPEIVGPKFLMLDTQLFAWLAQQGEVECENRVLSVRSFSGKSLSRNHDALAAMKYHDNAFAMKMLLCYIFGVSRRARIRSANLYLSAAIDILSGVMSRDEAVQTVKKLYPEWKFRIGLMGLMPRPKIQCLKKIYNHFVFPCAKYRNAFA